ncbi:oxidoreductase [Aureococcus anophagefferens]|nr:oxidoreductase [Aureococcus anophagefferens]
MRRRALALLWLVARSRGGGDGGGFLDFELSNGFELPVVGLGVGNLAHRSIPAVVSAGVERFGVRLVDTAMASNNEHLLQETLRRLPRPGAGRRRHQGLVHAPRLRPHAARRGGVPEEPRRRRRRRHAPPLAALPRRHRLDALRGEEAEAELRYGGPAPGADAWVGSWRALEEFYGAGRLAAIGVSNFDYDDMARLLRDAAVAPHVYQGNVWAFLFDPRLVELLREHRVRFVAYNVASGAHLRRDFDAGSFGRASTPGEPPTAPGSTVDARAGHERRRRAPRGRARGRREARRAAAARGVDAATLVLKALAQRRRDGAASSEGHLAANAPPAVAACGALDPFELGAVERAMRAPPRRGRGGDDRPAGAATLKNAAQGAVRVFWENESTGERVPVTADIAPGTAERLSTHPGHKFVAYRGAELLKTFTVTAPRGGWQEFEL